MHVHDEIPHVSVVHSLLRLGSPRRVGAGIIRVDADDVEVVEILELGPAERLKLTAEYQVKQLPGLPFIRHCFDPCRGRRRRLRGLLRMPLTEEINQFRVTLAPRRYEQIMHRIGPVVG
jgi:hypothetical protein